MTKAPLFTLEHIWLDIHLKQQLNVVKKIVIKNKNNVILTLELVDTMDNEIYGMISTALL